MSETEDEIPMEKVRDLINQPVEGLLYDLNMLPEVLATLDKVNTKQWLVMKVIQALYEKQEWISVDDRLPEEQGHYLVHCPRSFPKNYRGKIAEFYTDNQTFYCEYSDYPIEDATHWKPLPEEPKN